ncbi:MAG TPA: alpha/beta fold hydrolase [Candidatus Dormibacteraeota bacterium]|nr:alpha/beta fold hydrolase [Candidatus Dormibacteraeota bacterium]
MEATINGARIHYEREGEGMPVIFLHAGIADSRMWQPQLKDFAKHFDVVCPDTRGFGQSELPHVRWSEIADVLALIDHLGLKPAHFVGCSLGSAIAMDFAIQHAERLSKLVVVGPSIGGAHFGKNYPEVFAEVRAADEAGDLDALNLAEMHLFLDGPRRPHGYVKGAVRELFLDMNGKNFGVDFTKAPTDDLAPPAIERLHEITAPTLVVVGDEDVPPVFDAAEILMEKVPHARKVVIHDAAHLPNLEHPDEFNRVVLDFLLED